jgi:DNA-binding ferritin-like protein
METLHADIGATEDKYNDAVTSNLLQEMSDKHHKMAWMLRMILQESTLE